MKNYFDAFSSQNIPLRGVLEGKIFLEKTRKQAFRISQKKKFPAGSITGEGSTLPRPLLWTRFRSGNVPRPQGGTKAAHPLHPSLVLKQQPLCIG